MSVFHDLLVLYGDAHLVHMVSVYYLLVSYINVHVMFDSVCVCPGYYYSCHVHIWKNVLRLHKAGNVTIVGNNEYNHLIQNVFQIFVSILVATHV